MKEMNWNYEDLITCPAIVLDEIVRQINMRREKEELDALMRQ